MAMTLPPATNTNTIKREQMRVRRAGAIAKAIVAGLFAILTGCGEPAEPKDAVSDKAGVVSETVPTSANDRQITAGWRETVISVSSLDEWRRFFENILEWEIRAEGAVPQELRNAWKLPESASAGYALFANPGSESGFVRVINFEGVEQVRIRPHDQAWEVGGIFNMNMRVGDMADVAQRITAAGWQAPSSPVRFAFGSFIVWEWIPRHSDGVRIAFIERVEPPLENWRNLRTTSRTFNSTQIVADLDRANTFYQGALGFETYLDHFGASDTPGEHVLGLSREAMTSIKRHVHILSPTGENEGSVELLQFEGYSGRDFSDRAKPPNLGNLILRFPVEDAATLADFLKRQGIALEYGPIDTTLAPYGDIKIFAVRAPDGAWLEFFEEVDER